MKTLKGMVLRGVIIVLIASAAGLGVNLVRSSPIPYIYDPPKVIEVAGRQIPVIDAKAAKELLDLGEAVFVDAREAPDFHDAHIPGAVSLPETNMQEAFITVQPLMPEESKLIVYCSGPECEMAETVAGFLSQMGYEHLYVFTEGVNGWKKADYPLE
jgi:rhodanese-related sulfurtransferase